MAERLVDLIPCAEQVRFLRTGAEATAAAVRLARAATGRSHIVACGYFGWLDWCSDCARRARGRARRHHVDPVRRRGRARGGGGAARRANLAAVILEPLVHDVAPAAWLSAARRACDRTGAVLIFDEIKTAFRVRTGGVQELLGVLPDLTTLGKAMANGYPLAAVVGRAGVMEACEHAPGSHPRLRPSPRGSPRRRRCSDGTIASMCPNGSRWPAGMLQEIIGTALAEAPWVGVPRRRTARDVAAGGR